MLMIKSSRDNHNENGNARALNTSTTGSCTCSLIASVLGPCTTGSMTRTSTSHGTIK